MRSLTTALVAVFLCSCAMTPEQCRSLGVDVPDGATMTGRVVEEHIADQKKVSAMCGFPTKGCAIPVFPGDWIVWSIDDSIVRAHEHCAAVYQTDRHTDGLDG